MNLFDLLARIADFGEQGAKYLRFQETIFGEDCLTCRRCDIGQKSGGLGWLLRAGSNGDRVGDGCLKRNVNCYFDLAGHDGGIGGKHKAGVHFTARNIIQRLTHVRDRDYGTTRLTFLRYQ